MKRLSLTVLGVFFLWSTAPADAAELLMLHQPGCAWCARFESEIGQNYPKTDEARIAPLRRIDITRNWPGDLDSVSAERFTPTFILMDQGREVSRMRGYPGDEFFWFLLDEMIAKLPPESRGVAVPAG